MLSLQPSPRNEDRSPGRRAEAPAPPSDSPAVAAVDEEDAAQGAGDAHVRGLAHQHHDGLDELHQQHTRLQQRGRELAEHLFVSMSEGWEVSLRVQGSHMNHLAAGTRLCHPCRPVFNLALWLLEVLKEKP